MGTKTKQLIKTENLLSFWDVTQCSLVQMPQILGRFPTQILQPKSRHLCIKITCLHSVESPAQEPQTSDTIRNALSTNPYISFPRYWVKKSILYKTYPENKPSVRKTSKTLRFFVVSCTVSITHIGCI